MNNDTSDVEIIRGLLLAWAAAVRRRDYIGILESHSADIVMFDVPPPLQIKGIEDYKKTWDFFYAWSRMRIPFDFIDLNIVAGPEVAFAFATLNCAQPGEDGRHEPLVFRLTVGLQKREGRWTIIHEHHSVPAET